MNLIDKQKQIKTIKLNTIMKTMKLFSLLVVTGFVTMSMGFPTDLAAVKSNAKKSPCQSSTPSHVVMLAKADISKDKGIEMVEEEPVQEMNMPVLPSNSKITVKVFDVKGSLVMNQQVTMDEFLSKSKTISLPTGSTFVMFYENTAYYFLETG
jgi:hypothetical protein